MVQRILPMLPSGSTELTDTLSVVNAEGRWTYFQGVFPVFTHAAGLIRQVPVWSDEGCRA